MALCAAATTDGTTAISLGEGNACAGNVHHTFLQLQVLIGNQEALDEMCALGLEWDQTLTRSQDNPMHKALQEENAEWARMLLLRLPHLGLEPNVHGLTPLHLACRMDMEGVASELLSMGVDKNARDNQESTPLHHAVRWGSRKCVKLLIAAGCDLDAMTYMQLSPLDQALSNRYNSIVALLLRAGCNIDCLIGHRLFREDFTNSSFFCALWEKEALDNMQLFLDCGYQISNQEMNSLKSTCHQLRSHKVERDTLEMLKDFTEKPHLLSTMCRTRVRQTLMETRHQTRTPMDAMIDSLPLPAALKRFLMLKKTQTVEVASSDICQ